jgi:hypothetical protein
VSVASEALDHLSQNQVADRQAESTPLKQSIQTLESTTITA